MPAYSKNMTQIKKNLNIYRRMESQGLIHTFVMNDYYLHKEGGNILSLVPLKLYDLKTVQRHIFKAQGTRKW